MNEEDKGGKLLARRLKMELSSNNISSILQGDGSVIFELIDINNHLKQFCQAFI